MLAEQNNERVKADTARIKARIAAEQEQSVQLTAAQQELQVSMLERDAAVFQAAAMVTKAQGERDTINLENIAQTEILKNQVQALGSGMELARLTLYRKLAPRVDSILSSDNEQGLGSLLWPFLPEQQLSKP
jgi:regulator of protease activity HflC (stomatin/prohibitin superfamily)